MVHSVAFTFYNLTILS